MNVRSGDVNGEPRAGETALALHISGEVRRQRDLLEREGKAQPAWGQTEDRAAADEATMSFLDFDIVSWVEPTSWLDDQPFTRV